MTQKTMRIVMTGALLLAALHTSGLSAKLPDAEALKIETPPQIDGILNEPFWAKTKSLGEFTLWSGSEKGRPTADTNVRLAYDDTWLYLGLECTNQLQKLILAPKVKEHDGSVNTDESVEIFLTSDPRDKVYYHFLLSCFNVKAEQRFIEGQRERQTWNLPWRSATVVTENGWTAEIALPLYLFLEYGDFEHIRLNVMRNRRCPQMDACMVITHDVIEASLWRPVVRTFHEISAFGTLAAPQPGKLQVPFLPSLETATVKPYSLKDGTNHYGLELMLKSANQTPGTAELVISDQPAGGASLVVRERVEFKGMEQKALTLAIPAPVPSERLITVELRDTADGATYRTTTIENPAALKIMEAYLDRNYYTTESEAVAVAEIALPTESLAGMTVAALIDGKVVGHASALAETHVRAPIAELPLGTQAVTIALQRPDGATFYGISTELIKRAPKPGREVKIDQINRVVLKNDQPFFPFGPVMAGIAPDQEEHFKAIAEAGCNTFVQWHRSTQPEDARCYADQAQKHDLTLVTQMETGWMSYRDADLKLPKELLGEEAKKITMWQSGSISLRCFLMFCAGSPTDKTAVFDEYFEKNIPLTKSMIESVKDHPNLIAYNSFDEPCGDSFFTISKSLDLIYRQTHQTDGYHPVMLLYSSHIPDGDKYIKPCDILCTDPYWIPGGDPQAAGRTTPNYVSKIVHWNDLKAAKYRKAVWIVPVGWIWSGSRKRGITLAEQDCQNFLAIIHGARGLFWFRYPMPEIAWDNLKAAIAKVKIIGPMAVQPKVAQVVQHQRATSAEPELKDALFQPEREEFPDLQGKIFRNPAGGLVLLAANSRYYPVTAQVRVAGLSGAVSNIFGGANLAVSDGVFTEELEPFAVRAWTLGSEIKEPIQMTLATIRPDEIPPPEMPHAYNARAGKKNVFPNPSFEETTVPEVPDYYFGEGVIASGKGVAKFGDKCLSLTKRTPAKGSVQAYWECSPQHDKDTEYVWSFWAKGAKDGESIWVRAGQGGEPRTFKLTDQWARYELPLVMPARTPRHGMLFEVRLSKPGTIYLDGMQLEQGHQATEFED